MSCIATVRDWIDSRELISPGDRIVAAVSGGPDSMALLEILHELSRELSLDLVVAHFDHRLRPESAREAALVERRARSLGLPSIAGAGDVRGEARRTKRGIEETGRLMRHRFLEEAARAWGAGAVALGHTRDDQAETILLNIIRGTGWRGLCGMPARRGIFIRPLLRSSHAELTALLRRRGVRYAVDPTNRDQRFLRNRVRRRLIPELRKRYNPAIEETLLRLGENVAEGLASLEAPLARLIAGALPARGGPLGCGPSEAAVRLPAETLARLGDFELYLLLDMILRERFAVVQDVEKRHFDAAKRFIRRGASGRRIELPHGMSVSREHGCILIGEARPARLEIGATVIARPGRYALPGWNLVAAIDVVPRDEVRLEAARGAAAGRVNAARASSRREAGKRPAETSGIFASLVFPLTVRARRPGDALVPLGMRGTKKTSDIFIDRKVPRSDRDRLPVFSDRTGVFWIPGVVSAERTRVTPRSRRIVRITIGPGAGEPAGDC